MNLTIEKRTVKEINGIRPFQRSTLDALNSKAQIIIVDAPVGSGKSHIVRQVIDHWNGAVILTYPTKILMDSQRSALKHDFPDSIIWPYDSGIPKSNSQSIFYYSSDSLINYLKEQKVDYNLDRSELIDRILHQHFFATSKNIFLTSPDVLHILYNLKGYRGSKRLASFFTGSIVVFDEFHLYVSLKHFPELIDYLFNCGIKKIILLSATPVISEEMNSLFEKYETLKVDFSDSIGTEDDKIFNYPLNLEFVNCQFTKIDELLPILKQYIPILPKPLAIIFDSVFRLRHILPLLKTLFDDKWRIIEYSGFYKDPPELDEKTILVGTSSIEVGINMVFKSLITEASYWTSAIQRIGRVGRFCEGNVIVLTRKNMEPYILSKSNLNRDELENNILKSSLRDIKMSHVCGDMFRGDSYPFLVYDVDVKKLSSYSDSIFAMYDPKDRTRINEWQILPLNKKKELLKKYIRNDNELIDIIFKDKISPFWGLIEGKLRNRYENISVQLDEDELVIICENSNETYYFEKRM